jgi:hypothetical protein
MEITMKTIIALLLASCAVSLAQINTNTDSRGYVTNAALLTPFTLTNSSGKIVTNAVLVKLSPNTFIYKTPDGEMGVRRLDSLPKDLRENFGYDPVKAAQADAADAEKKTQQDQMRQRQIAQAAAYARYQAIKAEVEQGNRRIEGKVLQKIPEGLLVDSGAAAIAIDEGMHNVSFAGGTLYEGTAPGVEALGLVLLQDYPDPNIADEGHVDIIAYPVGLFTYDSVNKSSKTVRKFSCDLDKAIRTMALEEN